MELDDLEELPVVEVALREAPGEDGMVIRSDARLRAVDSVLARVVEERDQPQARPLVGARRDPVDVPEHVRDVMDDGALAVTRPRVAPSDSRAPLRVGADALLELALAREREAGRRHGARLDAARGTEGTSGPPPNLEL